MCADKCGIYLTQGFRLHRIRTGVDSMANYYTTGTTWQKSLVAASTVGRQGSPHLI